MAYGRLQKKALDQLSTGAADVAIEAAKRLVRTGRFTSRTKRSLNRLLGEPGNPSRYEAVVYALSQRGSEVLPVLVHVFVNPLSDPNARGLAAEGLGMVLGSRRRWLTRHYRVLEHLERGLFDDAPEVRIGCVWALACARRLARNRGRLEWLASNDHARGQNDTLVSLEARRAIQELETGRWPDS